MNIIDTATVTILLVVVALAVLAVVVAAGVGLTHWYLAQRAARPARTARPAVDVLRSRYAH